MRIGSKKWVVFKFIPYEYKNLERYLEKMALKGWILESVVGYFLKFTKIEPKDLKYSVDVMDKISMFVGSDSKSAVEYREYCEAAGWKFIAQMEKIQIYCKEDEVYNIPIQTDEELKYKSILKASLKYGIINIFCVSTLLYSQYINTFGSIYPNFLADNFMIILPLICSLWFIQEVVQFIHLIIWAIKGRFSLKRHEEVSYDFKLITNIKLVFNKILFTTAVLMLFITILSGLVGDHLIKVLTVLAVSIVAGIILFKITKKISHKDEKRKLLNISAVIIILVIDLMIFSKMTVYMGSTGILGSNSNYSENYTLTIEDFNYKSIERDYDKKKSILVSYEDCYDKGDEDSYLSYYIYRSKYDFIIDYVLNKEINLIEKYDGKVTKIEDDLHNNIEIYKSGKNKFILISDNMLISIYIDVDNFNEDEIINIIYSKVFKSAS